MNITQKKTTVTEKQAEKVETRAEGTMLHNKTEAQSHTLAHTGVSITLAHTGASIVSLVVFALLAMSIGMASKKIRHHI